MNKVKILTIAILALILGIVVYLYTNNGDTVKEVAQAPAAPVKIAGVDVVISEDEQKTWQMQTAQPVLLNELPISSSMGIVTTPPESKQIVSLPMNATIHKVLVSKYATVQNGDILAVASSPEWLSGQQQLLSASIAASSQQSLTNNKNILCKEGVIAQKECIMANSELKIKQAEANIAKSLLSSYGVSSGEISRIINNSSIEPTFEIKSKLSGVITDLNASAGASVPMLSTIFKVQGKSSVWIESLLSKKAIEMLKVGDEIIVEFGAKKFNSTVLQIASTLEGTSQSVKVLFNVPKEVMLMAGSKDMVKVFKATNTLYQVPKIAVTTIKTKEVVFGKVNGGFRIINLDVVHSDDNFFYIKNAINVPVAMNNIVILKNLVGGNDDK